MRILPKNAAGKQSERVPVLLLLDDAPLGASQILFSPTGHVATTTYA